MRADSPNLLAGTLELAQSLIRIPSFNPPGQEHVLARFAAGWLNSVGISSELIALEADRSSLVARLAGEGSGSLVLCGHLDTVAATSQAWHRPPLQPEIRDARLWGLGAADMKAAVAVLMQTCAQLSLSRTVPKQDIVLLLTADEEWGYRGAASVAASGRIDDARLVLIAEPTRNLVHLGQKGELWLEARFTGSEGHGSMPEEGTNAILPAARFCTRIEQELSTWPAISGRGRTTLNIGRFDGGRQVNIVPESACVQLDIRVASNEHHIAALDLVTSIGEAEAANARCTFSVREISYHPPVLTSRNHPCVRRVIERLGADRVRGLTPYSTDAVSISPILDVPILICGPGSIRQAHQPNEFIEVSEIETALETYAALVA